MIFPPKNIQFNLINKNYGYNDYLLSTIVSNCGKNYCKGFYAIFRVNKNSQICCIPHEEIIIKKSQLYKTQLMKEGQQTVPVVLLFDKKELKIDEFLSLETVQALASNDYLYKISRISRKQDNLKIDKVLNTIQQFYIADGHHRFSAARAIANANGYFDLFVYLVPTDQIKLKSFYRGINFSQTTEILLQKMLNYFEIEQKNHPVFPGQPEDIGLYLDKEWYFLKKRATCKNLIDAEIGAVHLERQVFQNIPCLRPYISRGNLQYFSSIEQLISSVDTGLVRVGITVKDITMGEFIDVVLAKKIMPAHTTCFYPKMIDNFATYRQLRKNLKRKISV